MNTDQIIMECNERLARMEALLARATKCRHCRGSGVLPNPTASGEVECPLCKGTGKDNQYAK